MAVPEEIRTDEGIDVVPTIATSAEGATCPNPILSPDTVAPSGGTGDGIPWVNVPRYEILSELRRAGMGVVYKARQTSLNRIVALKVMLAGGLAGQEERARFQNEAETAARLRHPNIVQVYEVGEHAGCPFLTMEFVEGRTLGSWIASGPADLTTSSELMETVARAVHAAHRAGVVHRDLKPDNILVGADGMPKITDFGLARRQDENLRRTKSGTVLGTPVYMAPEQAQGSGKGRIVGPSADIHALGVILYELLTGVPPFTGETLRETLERVIAQIPDPPRRLRPTVPRDLEVVCLKCLEKDPARRYSTAEELADDLSRCRSGEPIQARPPSVGRRLSRVVRRRQTALAMGLLLMLLTGSAVVYLAADAERRRSDEDERTRTRAAAIVEVILGGAAEKTVEEVERLEPIRAVGIELLRATAASDADPRRRFRAGLSLALLDEGDEDWLVDAAANSEQVDDWRTILIALRRMGQATAEKLHARFREERRSQVRVRLAFALLQFGDVRAAAELAAPAPNPSARTAFIFEFARLHGELSWAPAVLRTTNDAALRSALCAALGRIPPETLKSSETETIREALAHLYLAAPDGGTHSATGWALRRWLVPLPELKPTDRPAADRGWFVNRHGMTMVRVPAGTFVMGDARIDGATPHRVTLSQDYFMQDREVSVALFKQFLDDPDWLAAFKPDNFPGHNPEVSPTPDCPVQRINWFDAVRFCNWLSRRNGKEPCYDWVGDAYRCDFGADGYRLPTEAEWEYACRAGSTSLHFFGDDDALLAEHGWIGSNSGSRTRHGGEKLPNSWGLFDMHGNVWEWCNDWFADDYHERPVTDPLGPVTGKFRAIRGGGFLNASATCRSAGRLDIDLLPSRRLHDDGFRVVCPAGR